MEKDIILLLIGAFLALGGALAQSLIGWTQAQSDRRRELLVEAYSQYLTGVAERASILRSHSQRTEEATAKIVAGKQKVCAFAPVEVVKALAALEKTPLHLSSKETQEKMVGLVNAMRKSVAAERGELGGEISDILFSAEIIQN